MVECSFTNQVVVGSNVTMSQPLSTRKLRLLEECDNFNVLSEPGNNENEYILYISKCRHLNCHFYSFLFCSFSFLLLWPIIFGFFQIFGLSSIVLFLDSFYFSKKKWHFCWGEFVYSNFSFSCRNSSKK